MKIKSTGLLITFSLFAIPAYAHTGLATAPGLVHGILHPMLGLDHLLVMLAVGVWAIMLGAKAWWQLPFSFLVAMVAGAGMAWLGFSLHASETLVAFTLLAIGLLLWQQTRLSTLWAAMLVALFAVVHGYVHAVELTSDSNALAYAAGFLLGTALLHAIGLSLGILAAARLKLLGKTMALACTVVGIALLAGV
ncbi:MAG: HupE/UreJ family protein [Methylococcaceae bacterium]